MKTPPVLLFVATLALLALMPLTSQAKKPAGQKQSVTGPTTITSISPKSITVKNENATKTYAINQFTEFSLNGEKVTIDMIKTGMEVQVVAGTDPLVADRIEAGDAVKGTPKKKKG